MSANTVPKCVSSLEENSKEVYLETTSLLLKLIDNVLREPANPKYRSIRLTNPQIANKLLPAIGAMECLFSIGFIEGEDNLILPANSSLENLKPIRNAIAYRRDSMMNPKVNPVPASKPPITQPSTSKPKPQITTEKPKPQSFLQQIEIQFLSVQQYEDITLQARALQLIPVVDLELKAMHKLRKLQLAIKQGEKVEEVDIQEIVLIEMLDWFKSSFFKWVDSPECKDCAGKTECVRHEMVPGEGRTEVYECTRCKILTLFPRYNHVSKLLESRRGRCGEWANCFTFLCRAMGWDARLVVDTTDHVWTEVYSETQGRWLHCDACENAFDNPLMYEHGWGKKLSYIIAYSRDEIQDVTWRYSSNHRQLLSRRNLCSEQDLLRTMLRLKSGRQLSAARRAYLDKRLLRELVELMTEKQPQGSGEGRSSGSLAWRLARGEVGAEKAVPYIWTPTLEESSRGEMRLAYSCALDEYNDGQQELSGWRAGVFEAKSVFRKEEKDWKKVYLARTEGSDVASVTWKFDVTPRQVEKVRVVCRSDVYETGAVVWTLCGGESCVRVQPGEAGFETWDLRGSSTVTLTAELSGGKGNTAWQHTQLFRQDSDNKAAQLDVTITFTDK